MRETKRRIPQFAYYDKAGIQSYLEKQAAQGWMIRKLSFGWVFERMEPKKLHFFVSYFYKKSVFEADGSEEQKRFWEFCEHAGWKLAATSEQMQIFYNEEEEPVPIETDALLEVEKIHRSAGKSFLLPYSLLLLSFLLQIGSRIGEMRRNPLGLLSDDVGLLVLFSGCLLGVYVLREIIRYFFWHRKAVKLAETEGVFAPAKGVGKVWSMIPFFAIFGVIAGVLLLGEGAISHAFVVMLLMLTVSMAFITGISGWMKRRGVSAAFNRLAVIVLAVLVCVVATRQLFMMVVRGNLFPGREPAETYEYNGWTYEVYHDRLPLTVEELFGREEGSYEEWYSYELAKKESVFLSKYEIRQDPRVDVEEDARELFTDVRSPGEDAQELPALFYTVTQIKAPFLYDWCVEKTIAHYEERYNNAAMRRMEEEPWSADAAWRLYAGEEKKRTYVVCYGDVILELNASWELTAEQMAVAGKKMKESY